MKEEDVCLEKERIRSEMRLKRRNVSAAKKLRVETAIRNKIASLNLQSPIAVYFATRDEISIDGVIADLFLKGAALAAPQWNGLTYNLAPLQWGLSPFSAGTVPISNGDCPHSQRGLSPLLRVGPMGVREPISDKNIEPYEIKTWLVPGMAFTQMGGRLGYGGGWYDRLLSRANPDSLRFGVAYDFQILPALPFAEHDIPLTGLLP